MRETASVRMSMLLAIIQNLAHESAKLKGLLTRHGLSDARLSNPHARIDMRSYLAFFKDASVTYGDPILGARLGMALKLGDFWPLGLLLMQASSIESALGYFAKYAPYFQSATSFPLQKTAEGLVCGYRVHVDIKPMSLFRQDSEFALAGICSVIRMAFDKAWHPLAVHFEHPSDGYDAVLHLQKLFASPIHFSQPNNCIIVAAEDAKKQYRVEDRGLVSMLNQHMASLIAANDKEISASDQLRALISVRLGMASVDLSNLAQEMGMTPRSLQRRLTEEGTSLREILQDYRQQLATAYLAQANMSLDAISSALGYAESAAFSRAFKAWTGTSPIRSRQH